MSGARNRVLMPARIACRLWLAVLLCLLALGMACLPTNVSRAHADDGPDASSTTQMQVTSLRAQSGGDVALMRDSTVLSTHETIQQAFAAAVANHASYPSQTNYTVRLGADIELAGDAATLSDAGIVITVQSDGTKRTIRRNADGGSLFTVTGGATLQFADVIVDGARDEGLTGGNFGGLASVSGAGSKLVLKSGATFQNSASSGQGGALYIADDATAEMQAGSIGQDCSAHYGGFASVHRNNADAAGFMAGGAIIRNNTASMNGGALFLRGSWASLWGATHLYGNQAAQNGWAVFAGATKNGYHSSLAVAGTTSIVDNGPSGDGSDKGGAVYLEADGTDYWGSAGSTLTVSGSPMISSNRWNNGDKANVVVSNRNQIIVGSDGFATNEITGMPAARIGVRFYDEGWGKDYGDFARTELSSAGSDAYYAFQNDDHPNYTGTSSTNAGYVQWAQYTPVCKIVNEGTVHLYPTITDAMADANTKFAGDAVTIEMLVASYDFRYEFYYPETIIEPASGSTVPRNYQGVVCSNPNGVTLTKASATATDGYPYNGGKEAPCVINRNLTYTVYNDSVDLFGSMLRVQGSGTPATLTLAGITLDGSWDQGHYGRYGSFVFVAGNNHLVLGAGARLQNGHVAPISPSGYYEANSGDGGAVCVRRDATFTMLAGSVIDNCSASRDGGAVYLIGRGEDDDIDAAKNVFTMQDGARIANCSAGGDGGAVYAGNACTVRMAYSGSDLIGDGAGEVSAARNSGKVTGIADCTAAGDGGGVRIGSNAVVDFSGYWEVDRNHADGDGGGLWAGANSTLTLAGYNDDLARVGYNDAVNGGGVYAEGGTLVTMDQESCILENHATADGGGAYLGAGAELVLSGEGETTRDAKKAYISRNYSSGGNGGGVFAAGDASSAETAITLGAYTEISQNGYPFNVADAFDPADSDDQARIVTANGGGVYAAGNTAITMQLRSLMRLNGVQELGGSVCLKEGSTLSMQASASIESSYSGGKGGGVYAAASTVSQEANALVMHNVAALLGGGLEIDGSSSATLAGVVSDNTCTSDAYGTGGGGLSAEWSTVYVTGTMSGNTAEAGGAILIGNSSKVRLSGSAALVDNTAAGGGGACVLNTGSGSSPVLQLFDSARIEGNTATSAGGGVLVMAGANLVVAGSPVVYGNTVQGSANNVYLPVVADAVNAAGRLASERVQVVTSPIDGTAGLSAYAKVGIYSDTEEAAYEQFGESRALADDGWHTQDKSTASARTYLQQFYNDRDSSLRGTYGADDEVVWGVGLRVRKQVTGSMANRDKRFAFTFTFSGDAVGSGAVGTGSAATGYQVFRLQPNGTYVADAAVQLSESDRVVTGVELGDGDYIEFSGLYGDKTVRVDETDSLVRSAIAGAQRGRPYVVEYASTDDYGSYAYGTYIDVRANPSSELADDDWGGRTLVTAENSFESVVPTGVASGSNWLLFAVISGGMLVLWVLAWGTRRYLVRRSR